MSDTERKHFFRPWNYISMDESGYRLEEEDEDSLSFSSATTTIVSETEQNQNVKVEHEEEDDNASVISSSCSARNYNSENDSVSKRSSSVSSEDLGSSSLNMLSNFVLSTCDKSNVNERRHLKSLDTDDRIYANSSSVSKWNNLTTSNFYCPVYEYSNYYPDWPIHINNAASFSPDYTWLPSNYLNIQQAVNKLNQQDAVAKHIKKMRPKKFRCHYCNVAFSNNGQLKGHLRIHTGERPFKCDFDGCNKSFTRNEELTRHKRIHTGLRPYSCVICCKGFGRKDHLKKHTKTHDNRNIYQLSAVTGASTSFSGFHCAHYPSITTTGIPYIYPIN